MSYQTVSALRVLSGAFFLVRILLLLYLLYWPTRHFLLAPDFLIWLFLCGENDLWREDVGR